MIADVLERRHGRPDLVLVGFRLWVHGRQFPDKQDYYDGNWLTISDCCEAEGGLAWIERRHCLEAAVLHRWARQVRGVADGSLWRASLLTLPMDACLDIARPRAADSPAAPARFEAHATFWPSLGSGRSHNHEFDFDIGVLDLQRLLFQADRLVERFPLRGLEERDDSVELQEALRPPTRQ